VLLSGAATVLAIRVESIGTLLVCARSGLRQGELWRLLSGPLVHASLGHGARDLAVLAALGVVYEARLGWRFLAALVAATALPPLAAFQANPAGTTYFGLSAAVYGIAAAAIVVEWRASRLRPSVLTLALTLTVAANLLHDLLTGAPVVVFEARVASAPAAHLLGLLCGVVVGVVGACGPASLRRPGGLSRSVGAREDRK
jgi:rhomboid family GlyGly-CTERM serine protease